MILSIRLSPSASRDEIKGFENGILKVKVTAKPIENAANEALILILSKHLRIAKSSVRIKSGAQSRNKLIEIDGINEFKLES